MKLLYFLHPKIGQIQIFRRYSMELTPLDIRNQTFHKKNFGGIDAEEVKAFLETAAGAFEQMSREKTDLTERLNIIEKDINKLKKVFSSSWTPVPQDGGAALKGAAASWAGATLTETQRSDYENEKVKQ